MAKSVWQQPKKKFVLTIEIGNAEMYLKHHLAHALKKLAAELEANSTHGDVEDIDIGENGLIKDLNGNRVGHWRCMARRK
jgi:hypothetical protein